MCLDTPFVRVFLGTTAGSRKMTPWWFVIYFCPSRGACCFLIQVGRRLLRNVCRITSKHGVKTVNSVVFIPVCSAEKKKHFERIDVSSMRSKFSAEHTGMNTTDRLCGLVVRVSGCRYRGLGFDSRRYQIFWVAVGLERGVLSLVSLVRSIEELLE